MEMSTERELLTLLHKYHFRLIKSEGVRVFERATALYVTFKDGHNFTIVDGYYDSKRPTFFDWSENGFPPITAEKALDKLKKILGK